MKLSIAFILMAVGAYSQPVFLNELRPAKYDSCMNIIIEIGAIENESLYNVIKAIERHSYAKGCYIMIASCPSQYEHLRVNLDNKKRTVIEYIFAALQGTPLSFTIHNTHTIIIYKP